MSEKQPLLIIFPYSWLPYFSTVLNLYEVLARQYEVSILTLQPGYFTGVKLENINVIYVTPPRLLSAVFSRLNRLLKFFHVEFDANGWLQAFTLYWHAYRMQPKRIIAADSLCLWVAQRLVRQPHFLCVDITVGDAFWGRIQRERIKSVIISNTERYNYLFADYQVSNFIIENCPVYQPLTNPRALEQRTGLVYCGTSIPQWGIYDYLNFMDRHDEFILTIQGAVPADISAAIKQRYGELLASKRVVISSEYLESAAIGAFLNQFRIGFCLYNIEEIDPTKRFNQLFGSYGKLYAYYLAGVPVVATRMPGMRSVEDFEAGILIDEHSPAKIRDAIAVIEANYAFYVANCWKAAKHFDFNRQVQPFVEFLAGSAD